MKGLLYKDCATLVTSYKRNFLLILVLYTGMAVTLNLPYMLYAIVFVLGMYVLSTLSFDEASHWDAYVRTLPVSPAAVVGAKYLLALLFVGAGTAMALVICLALTVLKGDADGSFASHLGGCLASLAAVLLYYGVSYPLSYKVGATKARSWVLMVMALLFGGGIAAANFAQRSGVPIPTAFVQLNTMSDSQGVAALALLCLVALAVYAASWAISARIYQKKEY